jgi:hypothetical protein
MKLLIYQNTITTTIAAGCRNEFGTRKRKEIMMMLMLFVITVKNDVVVVAVEPYCCSDCRGFSFTMRIGS